MQISRLALRQPQAFALLGVTVALAGCASTADMTQLPSGQAAYDTIGDVQGIPAPSEYLLAPQDVVNLKVLNEPDISDPQLRLDNHGNLQVPLIGEVKAAGRPVPDVSREIRQRLAQTYIRSPEVSMSVVEPAKRMVSVEGEVKMPGVYELTTNTTLLGALAQAQSPLVTAKLDQVAIFRTINGQRMAARFNLNDIRSGLSPDPSIVDGDVVVVGFSRTKGAWQDFLKLAPIFNVFAIIATR